MNKTYQATYFSRNSEGNFVVSTESTPGAYLTPTTNREELLDNPWLAEKIYWDIVDWVREKANKLIIK